MRRTSKKSTESKHADNADVPASAGVVIAPDVRPAQAPHARRRLAWVVLLAIVVVAALVICFVMRTRSYAGKVCTASISQRAAQQNASGSQQTFTYLIGEIKASQHYGKDPNCLYIIAEYQLATGDVAGAQTSISQLKKSYSSYVFDKNLDSGHAGITHLQAQYNTVKRAQDNKNGIISPGI